MRYVQQLLAVSINLVFILVLSVKSIHFLTVSHEFSKASTGLTWTSKQDTHYCDFQFIKTPFDDTTTFHLKGCLLPGIQKKSPGTIDQKKGSSLKYTLGLRAPPRSV